MFKTMRCFAGQGSFLPNPGRWLKVSRDDRPLFSGVVTGLVPVIGNPIESLRL